MAIGERVLKQSA